MKKLVLGILVVACLQLGFVGYSAVEPYLNIKMVDITRAIPETVSKDPTQFAELDDADFVIAPAEVQPLPIIAVRQKTRIKIRRPQFVVAQHRARDTHFAGQRASRAAAHREFAPEFVDKEVTSQKKKSLMAKTLTVVKKPYDWLKALGARLK